MAINQSAPYIYLKIYFRLIHMNDKSFSAIFCFDQYAVIGVKLSMTRNFNIYKKLKRTYYSANKI